MQLRGLSKSEILRLNEHYRKLANKRSAQLKSAAREIKTLCKMENGFISSLDVSEALNSVVNIVPKLLKVSGCLVRLVDKTRKRLKLKASYGVSDLFKEKAEELIIGQGISGTVAKTLAPIAISSIAEDKRVKHYTACVREGMRSLLAVPIMLKKELLGVLIAYSKEKRHFSRAEVDLLSAFAAHAAIALNNALLCNQVRKNYYNTISTLVKAIEARDPYTCGHSERVTSYALRIAQKLNLGTDDLKLLLYSGKLHDIGKIAIPDYILKKKAKLTMAERATIEAHPVKGIEMINRLNFLEVCFPLIRHHHERYDGNGYPDGLSGQKIPFLSRILSIADAFDAMTSERPYRKGLTTSESIEEIKKNFEKQFDPDLAKLFLEILHEQPNLKSSSEDLHNDIDLAS